MAIEIKTFRFTCSVCGATDIGEGTSERDAYPDGWASKTFYDCGMTGYTAVREVCPDCERGGER